jgi:hypothetical protein
VNGTGWKVGARFSTPIHTGLEAASNIMGTRSLAQEVKQPGHGTDHPHTSRAEVKETVELNLYSLCGPSWPPLE